MASLIIEPAKWFCCLDLFEINGIPADYEDFGRKEDLDPDNAPDYGCGNKAFIIGEPTLEVIEKYGITESQWHMIANKLADALHFGRCDLCA